MKNNLTSIETNCTEQSWKQHFPLMIWIENPFFDKVCFHKEDFSGGGVLNQIQIHSEYIFTCVDLLSLNNEINKHLGETKILNERIQPTYVEDFINNGTIHLSFSSHFFKKLVEKKTIDKHDIIEMIMEILNHDVNESLDKAFDIVHEYEIKEFEKIKLAKIFNNKNKR